MFKRTLVLVLSVLFVFSSYAFALNIQDYEKQLSHQREKLALVSKDIKDIKGKILKLEKDYINADKQLRKDIFSEKTTLAESKGEEKAAKEVLRSAKERQAALRQEYYKSKNPLSAEMNKLKHQQNLCRREIKKIEGKIKKINEGYVEDGNYINKMGDLRKQLADNKAEFNKAYTELRNETKGKLAALEGREDKAGASKTILSEAKDKEIALRQAYNNKKALIKAEIEAAAKEHRKFMQENRPVKIEKPKEKVVKQKGAPTKRKEPAKNFSF